MNFFTRKRVLALLTILVLMVNGCAAMAEQVLVMNKAKVYASADEASGVLGTLSPGATLNLVAHKGGWAKVSKGSSVGFMKVDALTKIEEYNAPGYTTADTPMYKSFSESSKKMGVIPAASKVTVKAIAGDWAAVTYGKYSGFVPAETLTPDAPAKKESEEMSVAAYAKVDGAKVYNSEGKVITTVAANTQVTVVAMNGDVCRVTRDGATAYMMKNQLSAEPVEVKKPDDGITEITPATFYVSVDKAKVYNSKGKVIGNLSLNTGVTVDAYNDTLARVSKDGKTGLMYKTDLSSEKVAVPDDGITYISPKTYYVKADGAKVYNSKGKVIGNLNQNTALTVDAYNDTLARVSNGKNTGLMYKTDLSETALTVEVQKESGITEITPTTYYVKNEGAKVYSASKEVITTLSVNAAVTVNAYSDDLARVVNGNDVGFMYKTDLSDKKVEVKYELKYGDKGDAVKKVQTRLKELGYFSGSIGGNYLELTQSAVAAFQSAAKLTANGVCDEKTLNAMFADDAPKKKVTSSSSSSDNNASTSSNATGPSTVAPATGTAIEVDWWKSDIQKIFARGTVAQITDVATGMAWREKRSGGTNHADVQPLTAADTAAMRKAVGSWSWNRRAIFVTINGVNYAASMNCMPHGSGSIKDNGFDGHHCIHFTNSRTHGGNKVCSLHQNAIKKALKATL